MGQAGKDDLHLRQAPLLAVLREAAEPHLARGKDLQITSSDPGGAMPQILRKPEIIHGLRNLIQNAVDFAASSVMVSADWSEGQIIVRVSDDGAGFPAGMIGRIGDPFVRSRKGADSYPGRREYDGMGLGLFIAKTLLERTGAELVFSNGMPQATNGALAGAMVTVIWPAGAIAAEGSGALGENPSFLP